LKPVNTHLPHARPYTTVVLAMSADGKIADRQRQAARFGSEIDRLHLEQQIGAADAVLLGAGTLRAYGTSLGVQDPSLLSQRQDRGQSPQPVQILCSRSGQIDPHWRFFQQAFPRWLITCQDPLGWWWDPAICNAFERVLGGQNLPQERKSDADISWQWIGGLLGQQGIRSLAVLGGGTLVASLLAQQAIDELHLTLCPLLLGGESAPTPVEGMGWLQSTAIRLELLQVETIGHEVFLRYKVSSS
jgi:5-amino-6-(5-phosphoribosylamino)uracil reductase